MAVTKEVFDAQFEKIMQAIEASKGAVQSNLEVFKKESQEKAAEEVARKVKRSKVTEFKKKGNEIQFGFNTRSLKRPIQNWAS